MNVYDRIDELEHVLALLAGDVERLAAELAPDTVAEPDDPAQMGLRRSYVRAVFALVEAMVEQHARLLVDLHGEGKLELSEGLREALAPQSSSIGSDGRVVLRDSRTPLKSKMRAVYREAPRAFSGIARADFSDQGWRAFVTGLGVRNALVHPKSSVDCYVYQESLQTIQEAEHWYRSLHNDYIRLAREWFERLPEGDGMAAHPD